MNSLKTALNLAIGRLTSIFGRGLVISMSSIVLICVALAVAAFMFFNTAAPRTLTIASGPSGSSFQRYAERYQKILAREGVTLNIVPSEGSSDNLKRLADPRQPVEVGFVLGGEAQAIKGEKFDRLVALGAVNYQPLMVFYRGQPQRLLSDFKGRRINIGPAGSGTQRLALALLKVNGIEPGGDTTLDETDLPDPATALRQGRVDAVMLMSESTASAVTRELLRDETVRLLSFVQAEAYVRRFDTLHRLHLPRGALDFGQDIPPEDVFLIGPTVQLVARESLHPALSDLLLDAAREVHGGPGLYRKRGEFPVAEDGEFRLSDDAQRFYTSGKSFLYRSFPFWLASLIARVLAVLVPLVLLLVPAMKIAPTIYRWRMESRIYRWYRVLLDLEREAFQAPVSAARRRELLAQLDDIEQSVNRIVVPASFGDLFYALRGHIEFVRRKLRAEGEPAAADSGLESPVAVAESGQRVARAGEQPA